MLFSNINFVIDANWAALQTHTKLRIILMSLELTGLVKDFTATGLLSKIELDFLESELWETLEHIDEITSLTTAPSKVSKELKLKDGSSWQLCCAAVLDATRPQRNSRIEKLQELIGKNSLL
tara:strand:- start:384 stop:749 length:366 start_codon:yes stop_codon:yes gene_type:complete